MVCPWDSFRQSDLVFCEASQCAWVKEPANTWSNVGYLAAGIYILVAIGRRPERALLRALALVALVTAIGSAFYHASGIRSAMLADYAGMFLGTAALTALNVRRWLGWRDPAVWAVLVATTAGLLAFIAVFPGSERMVFMAAMPCCAIELRLFFRDRAQISYRFYGLAWLSVIAGSIFWWLDLERVWCTPDNHLFNGHAIWHLGTAASLVLYFQYYLQFEALRGSPVRPV
jgi:hypothetical protein